MNDKERLQTIKDQFEWGEENLESGIYNLESEEIKWLISRADKVEYWKKQHRKRTDELEDAYFKIQLLENKLQQAQAKIERCKEILKDIREASSDIFALRKAEQALQALEGTE